MASDPLLSRELKSLQDELSVLQRQRTSMAAATASPSTPAPVETAEDAALRDQLRELANEVTHFVEEAERGISTHPAQSVIGAMLLGILIGRVLGRH